MDYVLALHSNHSTPPNGHIPWFGNFDRHHNRSNAINFRDGTTICLLYWSLMWNPAADHELFFVFASRFYGLLRMRTFITCRWQESMPVRPRFLGLTKTMLSHWNDLVACVGTSVIFVIANCDTSTTPIQLERFLSDTSGFAIFKIVLNEAVHRAIDFICGRNLRFCYHV